MDLRELLTTLGRREISSLLVEGGAAVITSFLKEKLADRLIVILAPKIVGRGSTLSAIWVSVRWMTPFASPSGGSPAAATISFSTPAVKGTAQQSDQRLRRPDAVQGGTV